MNLLEGEISKIQKSQKGGSTVNILLMILYLLGEDDSKAIEKKENEKKSKLIFVVDENCR